MGLAGLAGLAFQNVHHIERLEREARELRADLTVKHSMVGESGPMRQIHERIAKAAASVARKRRIVDPGGNGRSHRACRGRRGHARTRVRDDSTGVHPSRGGHAARGGRGHGAPCHPVPARRDRAVAPPRRRYCGRAHHSSGSNRQSDAPRPWRPTAAHAQHDPTRAPSHGSRAPPTPTGLPRNEGRSRTSIAA